MEGWSLPVATARSVKYGRCRLLMHCWRSSGRTRWCWSLLPLLWRPAPDCLESVPLRCHGLDVDFFLSADELWPQTINRSIKQTLIYSFLHSLLCHRLDDVPGGQKSYISFNDVNIMPYKLKNTKYLHCSNNVLIKYASLDNLICSVCQNLANPETAALVITWA